MGKEQIINTLNRKTDHLAAQFGSDSKIRKAYLQITKLVVDGETLPNAIDKVNLELDSKPTKN